MPLWRATLRRAPFVLFTPNNIVVAGWPYARATYGRGAHSGGGTRGMFLLVLVSLSSYARRLGGGLALRVTSLRAFLHAGRHDTRP